MNTSVILLSIACISMSCLLCVSVYFNFKHGVIILRVQDALERSLDVLDLKYKNISEIAETPLFFDSTEVRQVVSDIIDARDSVLYVANVLIEIEQSYETNEVNEVKDGN